MNSTCVRELPADFIHYAELITHVFGVYIYKSKITGSQIPMIYYLLGLMENITNKDVSWTMNTPACEFRGVDCNDKKKVIKIDWEDLK